MKTNSKILSQLTVISLLAGALCLAGGAIAQTESEKAEAEKAEAQKAEAPAAAAVAAVGDQPAKADAASSLSEKDKAFIKKAAKGGMMEVELGNLAAKNAKNSDVKSFGERMVADHSKANEELKALAEKKGAKMPKKSPTVKWTSDKAYMDMMVQDHEKDLAEFQEQAKDGSDPDLKAFAERTAKVIDEHLNLAKKTQSELH